MKDGAEVRGGFALHVDTASGDEGGDGEPSEPT